MTRLLAPLTLATLVACGDKDSGDSGVPTTDDTGASAYATTQLTDGGSWSVSYAPDPDPIPAAEEFTVTVAVAAAGDPGTPLSSIETVVVDAGMPEHGHGMTVTPVTEDNGDGSWTAYPLKFHMTGDWTLTIEVTEGGTTETATFAVDCCEV